MGKRLGIYIFFYIHLFSIEKCNQPLVLQWIHSRVKTALHLSHLVLATEAPSEPSKCGLGSVQTKRRSTALRTCTVPSAQPQKTASSDRHREWAAPVWKQDTNGAWQLAAPFTLVTEAAPRATKCFSGASTRSNPRLNLHSLNGEFIVSKQKEHFWTGKPHRHEEKVRTRIQPGTFLLQGNCVK